MRELPVAFIAYDLIEFDGPRHARRAAARAARELERLADQAFDAAKSRGERLPLRVSPAVVAETWEALAAAREEARALGREGLMLKARDGAYGVGRRKGDDRTDVWWKWKLDPMSVDAVLIYAQRGTAGAPASTATIPSPSGAPTRTQPSRELVPFAKAYSGLSDAEMREMDAIIRRTTLETFGPVRSVKPTQVFELGFEGIAPSKRHRSGIAVRFPRMLRWRRDKPVAEADTLAALRALLPAGKRG